MGYNPQVRKVAKHLYGYMGDRREQVANIIIPKSQVGSASNDVGFQRTSDGKYIMHVSEYDRSSKSFREDLLKQLYAKHNLLRVINSKTKYKLKKQEKEKDGKIRIRLSRSNY